MDFGQGRDNLANVCGYPLAFTVSAEMYKFNVHLPIAPSVGKHSFLQNDPGADVEALLAFKQALDESSRLTLSSWNATALGGPCNWIGITCSLDSGRVIAIELAGLALLGSISPLLGRLQDLEKLELSNNLLTGTIPSSLANCTRLSYLAVVNNALTGAIPSQIGRLLNLVVLDLGTNFDLQGPIPRSLGNCSLLRSIRLDFTFINGEIPDSIGKLSHLEVFNLTSTLNNGSVPASLGNCSSLIYLSLGNLYVYYYNNGPFPTSPLTFPPGQSELSGNLPSELGSLKHLKTIRVAGTNIEGPLPSWLANISSLREIVFASGQFSGALPEYLGALSLEVLFLDNNLFSGKIPTVVGNISSLNYLDLRSNFLQGVVPSTIGRLTKLVEIDVILNSLEGKIPSSLSNCSALEFLLIGYNPSMDMQSLEPWLGSLMNLKTLVAANMQLTGGIPGGIGKLSQLYELDLGGNDLSGSIPKSLGNCSELTLLRLATNLISGDIPQELWKLRQLTALDISANVVTGSLSDGVANMSLLQVLYCESNSLNGTLPSRLTELTNLEYCDLGENNFLGRIPNSIGNMSALAGLDLSGNSFANSIPTSVGNLSKFTILALSENKLTGPIPGDLVRCDQMVEISLGVNELNGTIPTEIGDLVYLQFLNLSQNQLYGELPQTLSQCEHLIRVDVSYNALYGEIQGDIFANASSTLSTLDLSGNNFVGRLPPSFGKQIAMTVLLVSANNFSGPIPPTLGDCPALQRLDLSINQFNKTIPEALGNLRNLTLLNVSYNQLEGPLPDNGIFVSNNFSAEWFLGNPGLCGTRLSRNCSVLVSALSCRGLSCHSGTLAAIISCSAAFGLLVVGMGSFIAGRQWRAYRRTRTFHVQNQVMMFGPDVRLSGEKLVQIVGDPANLVGRGRSSTVYKADLGGGPMAVKILTTGGFAGDDTDEMEFVKAISQTQKESRTLAGLRHRNILKVLGMFSTSKMTGLLLEFMPMGSLHEQLHEKRTSSTLPWERRLNIALGIAHGLVYLHDEVEVPIIHRDLKPQNILLDADMTPKLGDFGISKFVNSDNTDESVTASQWCGTIGYIAPEYSRDMRVSTRGDVYSFGMVLLELLTGRRPTTEAIDQDGGPQNGDGTPSSRGDDDVHSPLVDWVYKRYNSAQSTSPSAVVDPALLGTEADVILAAKEEQQMKMAIQLGLLCTQDNPQSRPRMHDVLAMLTYIERLGEMPANIPSVNELAREQEEKEEDATSSV